MWSIPFSKASEDVLAMYGTFGRHGQPPATLLAAGSKALNQVPGPRSFATTEGWVLRHWEISDSQCRPLLWRMLCIEGTKCGGFEEASNGGRPWNTCQNQKKVLQSMPTLVCRYLLSAVERESIECGHALTQFHLVRHGCQDDGGASKVAISCVTQGPRS